MRPFDPGADAGRLAGLLTAIGPDPVSEDDADGRRFADRHGFGVRRHTFQSIVDAASLSPEAMQLPDPSGVTVTTLAVLGDTETNRHRIWKLHEESFADEPARAGATRRSYEHFTGQLFDTGWWQPQTQFVALADGQWAGVAVLRAMPQTNSFYNFYTGVGRAHRGRGVAGALKRATIRYALGAGAAYLSTSNDSANAPMLAVNRRFGYRPLPGVLVVARPVG